jgi:DNA-binding XRE family transcriptional regulator
MANLGFGPGERNVSSRLTEDKVLDIRRRYKAGGISQYALAAEYGVSQTTIKDITRGRTWKHVGTPADWVRHVNGSDRDHCLHGHPFDEENTGRDEYGYRKCLACHRRRAAAYKAVHRRDGQA